MSGFIPFDRSQPYLLPPDLKSWLSAGDMVHFVIAPVERVPMNACSVPIHMVGKAQCHQRLMLATPTFGNANGIFPLRWVKRAAYRDIGIRFVRRICVRIANEATFAQILLVARETGLLYHGLLSLTHL